MPSMVRAVITLSISILRSCAALFRSRQDQAIVELALDSSSRSTLGASSDLGSPRSIEPSGSLSPASGLGGRAFW
jgi:hypothetical protein